MINMQTKQDTHSPQTHTRQRHKETMTPMKQSSEKKEQEQKQEHSSRGGKLNQDPLMLARARARHSARAHRRSPPLWWVCVNREEVPKGTSASASSLGQELQLQGASWMS